MSTRELNPKETGKARSQRIQLDYHRARGWLYWSRWLLAIPTLLVTILYSYFVVASALRDTTHEYTNPDSWATHVSTGDLSSAHAHFANACDQCHDDQWRTAISSDAPSSLFGLQAGAEIRAVESKCQTCHQVAAHVPLSASSDCADADRNCASCHREHEGSNQNLRAVSSRVCIACHADLSANCGIDGVAMNHIDGFSVASHSVHTPNSGLASFRSLLVDSGRVKFDHDQHLQPGQLEAGEQRRGGFTVSHLPPRWQASYRGNAEGLVELSCENCHELEAGQSFYKPIDFEEHCVACHQLTYSGQDERNLPLTHGASREEIRTLLAAKWKGSQVLGKVSSLSSLAEPADDATSVRIADLGLQEAVDATFTLCSQCHLDEDVSEQAIDTRLANPGIAPLIPSNWLKHGMFDHQSHSRVDCQYCHEVSKSSSESRPLDNQLVMIEGPASCVGCHREGALVGPETKTQLTHIGSAPTELNFLENGLLDLGPNQSANVRQPNKAAADCTLCHRYHQ